MRLSWHAADLRHKCPPFLTQPCQLPPPCSKSMLMSMQGSKDEAELAYRASQLGIPGVGAPSGCSAAAMHSHVAVSCPKLLAWRSVRGVLLLARMSATCGLRMFEDV